MKLGDSVAGIIDFLWEYGMPIDRIVKDSGIDEQTLRRITTEKKCDKKTAKKLLKFVDRVSIALPSKTLIIDAHVERAIEDVPRSTRDAES